MRAYITKSSKVDRITPGTIISRTTMASYSPFVIGAGIEIIDIDPGVVAITGYVVPGPTGISPLD